METFKYRIGRKLVNSIKVIRDLNGLIHVREKIFSRAVFVVGCGNSGTTLAATILGRNSSVLAIGDETYAFGQNPIYIKAAITQWDILCRQSGKAVFVEKTPKHIYEISKIFRFIPKAKIIFVVRNPMDNIASLYRRTGNRHECIKRWIRDNSNGLKFKDDERVKLCYYDKLVSRPSDTVQELCRFLNIQYEEEMVLGTESVYGHWADSNEANQKLRSEQVTKTIMDNRGKGLKVFNEDDQQHIRNKTADLAGMLGVNVSEPPPM